MLCPRCGAYSPYNTSVCNRCGARLSGDGTVDQPRSKKYYRNARQSDWEKSRDQLLTKANDALDGILADRKKRTILIAAAAAAVVLLAAGAVGCISCTCRSCESEPVSASDVVSSADSSAAELPSATDDNAVSSSDSPAASDADVSASSVNAPSSAHDDATAVSPSDNLPADDDLVPVTDYIPSIFVELKYASSDNFTGKIIYDFTQPRLRYGTVKKLAAAQDELSALGYRLVLWDAYRPLYAQQALWDFCPDPTYVSDPKNGYCSHSRGHTVDVTMMVIADGSEVVMPSRFDEFSEKADRDYSDVPDNAAANAALLERVMTSHGFTGYKGEWWHYSDSTEYPLIEVD